MNSSSFLDMPWWHASSSHEQAMWATLPCTARRPAAVAWHAGNRLPNHCFVVECASGEAGGFLEDRAHRKKRSHRHGARDEL